MRLAFRQLSEGFVHILHLLLPLNPLPMLTPHISSNRIENTLKVVRARNLPLLLQFQKIRQRLRLNSFEVQAERELAKESYRKVGHSRSDVI